MRTDAPTGAATRTAATPHSAATPDATDAASPSVKAEQLHAALVAHICRLGRFCSARVEDAFRTVPRHRFLPGVDLEEAYAPRAVVTKRAADGTALSSASSPTLVVDMLELLDVASGHRVLEIGAATGFNAALLAELADPTGWVVTIELDDDLAASACANLAAAGYPGVDVIAGDGAIGYAAGAPYDRITVTAGAWDITPAWWQQLAIGGRLVVPLRLHGSGLTRVLPFDLREPDRLVATSAKVCGFVPMRGIAQHDAHYVQLDDDAVLNLDAGDDPDLPALALALTHEPHEHWTGIRVRHDEPAEHLDLWLATADQPAVSFGRLGVEPAARDSGRLTPARRWAGASLYAGATIAYLTVRPHSGDTRDTDGVDELGMKVHGPDTPTLTGLVDELLHQWARERPGQPTVTARPTTARDTQTTAAAHISRPNSEFAVSW